MWIRYVLLNDTLLVILELVDIAQYGYFTAPAQISGLANPQFLCFFSGPCAFSRKLLNEGLCLIRQAEGHRYEVVDGSKQLLIALEQAGKVIFGAKNTRLREVNELLVRFSSIVLSHSGPNTRDEIRTMKVERFEFQNVGNGSVEELLTWWASSVRSTPHRCGSFHRTPPSPVLGRCPGPPRASGLVCRLKS